MKTQYMCYQNTKIFYLQKMSKNKVLQVYLQNFTKSKKYDTIITGDENDS